jgi:hypothetical protein
MDLWTNLIRRLTSFQPLGWTLAVAAFAALAWRQLCFVNQHAVNVLFFDQWGFYYPLFHGQSWWQTFDRRHGPHREGIGLVLTRILANLSGWNSRWDAFAISLVLIAAALVSLAVLRRCGNRAGFAAMLAVPVLFFNAHQFEGFVGASNLSHGSMPVLLLLVFCLAGFIRDAGIRLLVLSFLTLLLIFTGFGLFGGVLAPMLFLVEGIQAARAGLRRRALAAVAALGAALGSWALFLRGYQFDPAQADFRFPYEKPLQYPVFVGRMFANFFGWAAPGMGPVILGLTLAAALVALCLHHGRRCWNSGIAGNPRSAALFFLTGFEILYCADTAVGRVMGGAAAPLASRYVTLLIPMGLVIVIELASLRPARVAAWSCVLFAAAIAPGCLILRVDELNTVNWYHDIKASWRQEYLATHSQQAADRRAKFGMYPQALTYELSFLQKNRLNLFEPDSNRR